MLKIREKKIHPIEKFLPRNLREMCGFRNQSEKLRMLVSLDKVVAP